VNGPESPWKAVTLVSVIGMDIVLCVLLGVWLGRKLDAYFGTGPLLMVVGVFVGIAAGVLIIIPIIRRFLGDQPDER